MHKKKAFQKLFLFFRDRLAKHEIATTNELEAIFSNINDLIELTLTLIGSLEDNLEMAEEGKAPAVGTCFEELAEAEDFDVYENYARDILDPRCQRTLEGLLGNFCFVHTIFHFWFLVTLGGEVTKIRKYYIIFVYILQGKVGKTEKSGKKITLKK